MGVGRFACCYLNSNGQLEPTPPRFFSVSKSTCKNCDISKIKLFIIYITSCIIGINSVRLRLKNIKTEKYKWCPFRNRAYT